MGFFSKIGGALKKVGRTAGKALRIAVPAVSVGALAIPGVGPAVAGIVGSAGKALGGLLGRVDNAERVAEHAAGGLAVAVREGRQQAHEATGFDPAARTAGAAINTASGLSPVHAVLIIGGGFLAFRFLSGNRGRR